MTENYPGHQEVEKSGGAPVEEGPPTTPDQVLNDDGDGDGDASPKEQRPDSDQAGHEPDEHGSP